MMGRNVHSRVPRRVGRSARLTLACALLLAVGLREPRAEVLGSASIPVVGLQVEVDTRPDVAGIQSTMTGVKNVPTAVQTLVGGGGSSATASLSAGFVVKAELSGPSYGEASLTLIASPNQLMEIPAPRAPGAHRLSNIRLEDGLGKVVLERSPERDAVVIDVIDELLVTQVTSRQLTLDEIRSKGIVIDEDNFTALNFTVGLTLGTKNVVINLPVIVPNTSQGIASIDSPSFVVPAAFQNRSFDEIEIPNFSIAGFQMRPPPELEEKEIKLPAINGVIVIPGSIGFLHSFFSVVLQATNVAPDSSGLVLRNTEAHVVLPPGADEIPASGDDPLRLAETAAHGVQDTLPLLDEAGSTDIAPQRTHAAEFLVEGLREGTHPLRFDIKGDLFVPSLGETVVMSGRAAGVVQVKNPTFNIVLAHPDVVRDGEEYPFFATVTNTSAQPANLFRLKLNARSLSGARLAAGESDTKTASEIPAGESQTFEFRLVARTTGKVSGTVFLADEGVNGSFILTTGVGDTGIPLSPDTLILPATTDALPDEPDLVAAVVRMLGQAYSVATAPAGTLPPNIARISKSFVFDRGIALGQAGLHAQFGQTLLPTLEEITMDLLGADRARLGELLAADEVEQRSADLAAFDALRRAADAGHDLGDLLGALLAGAAPAGPLASLQADWAERFASRPAHLSFAVSSRGPPLLALLEDSAGNRLGRLAADESVAHEIPFAERFALAANGASSGDIFVVAAPQSTAYRLDLVAPAATSVDLSLVVPDGAGMTQLVYPAIDLPAGARVRVAWKQGGASPSLAIDDGGDGTIDRSVAPASATPISDRAPGVVRVQQWGKGQQTRSQPTFETGDPMGRMLGVLFDEEVTSGTAMDRGSYALPANAIVSAALQSDRRLVFVTLEKPVGPFVAREFSVSGVIDLRGHESIAGTHPIVADPDRPPGGTVSGRVLTAGGVVIPFAEVRYIQPLRFPISELDTGCLGNSDVKDFVITTYRADGQGRFEIDYVLQSDFQPPCPSNADIWLNARNVGGTSNVKLEAADPATGEMGRASTRVRFDGQRLVTDVVIRGFGAIEGTVLDVDGVPVIGGDPGTPESLQVGARNLSTGEQYVSWVDAAGHYAFPRSLVRPDGTRTSAGAPAVGNLLLQVFRAADASTGIVTANLPEAGATVKQDIALIPSFRYGAVTGRVLEADGATGAANVRVQLAFRGTQGGSAFGFEIGEGVVGDGFTDAFGVFHFDPVPAGSFEVLALRQSTFEQARASSVVGEGETASLTIVFPGQGGSVHGLVRDAFGNAVAGATVAGGPVLTQTEADGSFRIDGLPIGSFTIYAQAAGARALGKMQVETHGPSEVQNVVITLEGVGSIEGTVFEADGTTRVRAQQVQLWTGPGVIGETFTDNEGFYRFANFPIRSDYSVRAVEADYGDGGQTRTAIRFPGDVRVANIEFRGLASEITGRVMQTVNAGATTPVYGANVIITRPVWRVIPDENISSENNYYVDFVQQLASTDEFGEAVSHVLAANGLGGAPPVFFMLLNEPVLVSSDELGPHGEVTGRFQFTGPATAGPIGVSVGGAFFAPTTLSTTIPRIETPAESHIDLGDILLEPSTGALRGTVYLPDGVTPVGEGVRVVIHPLGGGGSEAPAIPDYDVETDEAGSFDLPLVPAGRFTLTADTGVPSAGVRAETAAEMDTETLVTDGARRIPNVRLYGQTGGAVSRGGLVIADIRLQDVAGVHIRVVDNDGTTPVPFAEVTLHTGSTLDAAEEVQFLRQISDENGEINFFPVIEGQFSASASLVGSPQRGQAQGVVAQDPPNGFEVPITIQLGAVTTSSGQVIAAAVFGSVSGMVFKADGTALSNPAQITLRSGGAVILTTSDEHGVFLAEDVPAGLVRVEAFEPFTARRGSATGTLRSQDEVVFVPVTLAGLGSVTGHVERRDGSVLGAGIDVVLAPSGDFSAPLVTRTDDGGNYLLPGVPVGPYSVHATDPASGLAGDASDTMRADGNVNTTNVVLEGAGRIIGVVYAPGVFLDAQHHPVDAAGRPLANPPVAASASVLIVGSGFRETVQADASGVFTSSAFLRLGSYALFATPVAGVDGAQGTATISFDGHQVETALALAGQGRVEGVVLDSFGEHGVDKALVTLRGGSELTRGFERTLFTGPEGAFAFDAVPVGPVSISAVTTLQQPTLGASASGALARHGDALVFADGDADLAHQALRLQAVGSIIGSVGAAGAGSIVTLTGGGLAFTTVADANGDFRFEGLPLGVYRVDVRNTATGGVAGAGALIGSNGQQVDLSALALDASDPIVIATLPGANAVGVSPAAPIVVTFSESIDPASVDANDFRVLLDGSAVAGSFEVSAASRTVSFTPEARLPDLARIAVTLRGDRLGLEGEVLERGLRDLSGRSFGGTLSFQYATADLTPPVLSSASPADGASEVQLQSVVRIELAEPIERASIRSFTLTSADGTLVAGAINTAPILGDRVFVFTPAAVLLPNQQYVATLTGPLRDFSGNAMLEPSIAVRFGSLDTLPPIVTALEAQGGALVVGRTVSIAATLASAGDVASVEFTLNGALLGTDTSAPYAQPLYLDPALGGTASVRAVAVDQAGNRGPARELVLAIGGNMPPAVSLSLPGGGSPNAGSSVSVQVNASDDVALAQLALTVNDGAVASRVAIVTGASAQATFQFTVPADAALGALLTLRASATDTLGLVGIALPVELSIYDTRGPIVSIGSPVANTLVARDEDVTVFVRAEDPSGIRQITLRTSHCATGATISNEVRALSPAVSPASASFVFRVPVTAAANAEICLDARALDAPANLGFGAPVRLRVRDTELPFVTGVTPADGATDVSRGASASVSFSEPVAAATLSQATFTLVREGGAPVPAVVTLAAGGRGATLVPAAPLDADTEFQIIVATGVTDLAGNALAAPFTSHFTTQPADTRGPRLVELIPADGASGLGVLPLLRARFDEALLLASVTPESFSLRDAADAPLPTTLESQDGGQTLVLHPVALLVPGSQYVLVLTDLVTDAAGNAATDDAGNAFGTLRRAFSVGAFAISAPAAGARVIEGGPIHAEAVADAGLGVVAVTFLANGVPLASDAAAPFAVDAMVPSIVTLGGNVLRLGAQGSSAGGPATAAEVELRVEPASGDADGDGLTNATELRIGSDPFSVDADQDPDHDGLSNAIEARLGTDIRRADSDGDGLEDGVEDANHNGVVDSNETDPTRGDTDGDLIPDGVDLQPTHADLAFPSLDPLAQTDLAVGVGGSLRVSIRAQDADGDLVRVRIEREDGSDAPNAAQLARSGELQSAFAIDLVPGTDVFDGELVLTGSAIETGSYALRLVAEDLGGRADDLAFTLTVGSRCLSGATPGSDPSCPGMSCETLLLEDGVGSSGTYWIDPNGGEIADAVQAYCDMETDGGGYTFLKVAQGANASQAEVYCGARGMRLLVPRTDAHARAAVRIALDPTIGPSASSEYVRILGIYPNAAGATCNSRPLRSGSLGCNWSASDGGLFFVNPNGDVGEPNGDNCVGCSMVYAWNANGTIASYNDQGVVSSSAYLCDVGDHQGVEDADGDGIPDGAEVRLGSDWQVFDSDEDVDGDGLTNLLEWQLGTSIQSIDSDGDGLADGLEDANRSGVVDVGETDPARADSDRDGIPDGIEDANRNGVVDLGETDPKRADSDGDGLADGVEDANRNGVVDVGESNPRLVDSDADGIPDAIDVHPVVPDLATPTLSSPGTSFVLDAWGQQIVQLAVEDTDGDLAQLRIERLDGSASPRSVRLRLPGAPTSTSRLEVSPRAGVFAAELVLRGNPGEDRLLPVRIVAEDVGGHVATRELTLTIRPRCADGARFGTAACPGTSCEQILLSGDGVSSGLYPIDGNGTLGSTPVSAFCDMDTDGGGYTFFKVGQGATASQAETYCAERGMRLFVPRTDAHARAAVQVAMDPTIGPSASFDYMRILGIYPIAAGATCNSRPLRSGSPGCSWSAGDGGLFFVNPNGSIGEPSGDNCVGCSMAYTWNDVGTIASYNDEGNVSSSAYLCDVGDHQGIEDADGDGIPDGVEVRGGTDWQNGDAGLDRDKDGLSNGSEYLLGTSIDDPDSDGDGLGDGVDPEPLVPANQPPVAHAEPAGALVFDGVDDFAEKRSPSAALNVGTRSWTVEAWVRTSTATAALMKIASRYECGWNGCAGNASASYELFLDASGAPAFAIRADFPNTIFQATASVTVRDGRWHHVAGVLDRSQRRVSIYVDGVLRGTAATFALGAITDAGSPLSIGRTFIESFGAPDGYFEGAIDDLRVYAAARTEVQIRGDLAAPVATSDPLVVGVWPFDEGVGEFASDAAPDGNDAHLGAGVATQRPSWTPAPGATAGQDLLVTLGGSDPDGNPLGALVTQLASHGTLYQATAAGARGAAIASVPAAVSDAGLRIVYVAASGFEGDDVFAYRVSDGVAQSAETRVGVQVAALVDSDGDGLSDGEEIRLGTDPFKPSSDGGCLLDGWEITLGLDPLSAADDATDLDGDGRDNCAEVADGTNPREADTDGDGLSDGEERSAGSDGFVTNPLAADTDGDGLGDGIEPAFGLDPTNAGDGTRDLVVSARSMTLPAALDVDSLTLRDGAVLTVPSPTTTRVATLAITTGSLTIDATSRIDVSGRGYLGGLSGGNGDQGRTTGNTQVGGSARRSGGSYGGLGGYGGTFDVIGASYGDFRDPSEPGSGGGSDCGAGGNGGGLVRIHATSVQLDGSILADGGNGGGNVCAAGGSGGGIQLTTDTLAGTGVVRAQGGAAAHSGYSGGGGGGRIAVSYADASGFDLGRITTAGGVGYNRGGAGTVFLTEPAFPLGQLVISSGSSATPVEFGTSLDRLVVRDGASVSGTSVSVGSVEVEASRLTLTSLTAGALTLRDASTVTLASVQASAIELLGASLLTAPAPTMSSVTPLAITTGTLAIDATSRIDVSGRGYLGGLSGGNSEQGRTTGNTQVGGSARRSGGSYGGVGGQGNTFDAVGASYGDFRDPSEAGSGGGSDCGQGGNGGGLVRIHATSVQLDGSILADGGNGALNVCAAGGSGGGIQLTTGTLAGAGVIRAQGGYAAHNGYSGGGGGGRIAVVYTDASGFDFGQVTAQGGAGYWSGSAGTVYERPKEDLLGALVIDAGGRGTGQSTPLFSTPSEAATAASITIRGHAAVDVRNTEPGAIELAGRLQLSGALTIDDSSTLNVHEVRAESLALTGASVLTHPAATTQKSSSLVLDVGALSVDGTSRIYASARGYLGGRAGGNGDQARTTGNTQTGGSARRSGGSYGGLGGYGGTSDFVGASYGDFRDPNEPGSGGGSDCGPGGNGGGLVRIHATSVQLEGSILADGGNGASEVCAAGGSGGGIQLTTDTLAGAGLIRAQGGGSAHSGYSGGGGGGRIAVSYADASGFDLGRITTPGGVGYNRGGAGTVFLTEPAFPLGQLVISSGSSATPVEFGTSLDRLVVRDGASVSGTSVNVGSIEVEASRLTLTSLTAGALTLRAASAVTLASVQASAIELLGASLLTAPAPTTSSVTPLAITTGTLAIDATSRIDVSGRGYLGGRSGGNGDQARTLGNTQTGGSARRSGGSYGGLGGYGVTFDVIGASYGDFRDPNEPGSGGGSDCGPGGNGGGLVRIHATSVQLDGSILSDGGNGASEVCAAGGSGGGIQLTTDTLAGTGVVRAQGGAAAHSGYSGGGGGGRVAVVYSDAIGFDLLHVTALGGTGYQIGGTGTVYFESASEPNGALVIDARNVAPSQTTLLYGNETTPLLLGAFTVRGRALVEVRNPEASEAEPGGAVSVTGALAIDGSSTLTLHSVSAGSAALTNTSVLTHLFATLAKTSSLLLDVGALAVDATSRIDVSARGYLGGLSGGNGAVGRTIGNTATGGSARRSGGSYGGIGGYGDAFDFVGASYGDFADPNELGSGGGSDCGVGGNGGGLVRIRATSLQLDGSILADGGNGASQVCAAGGSGGGIQLTTGMLGGTGVIRAQGGAAAHSSYSGGGGGGRVAILYTDASSFALGQITAPGGVGFRSGSAGSVNLVVSIAP